MTRISQTRRSGRGPYGPNIVRAWFDTVFHYVLHGLETERSFLERHNWSFRQSTRTLEYIAPIARYVPAGARENLEQFLSFHREVKGPLNRHDADVQQLQERCNVYCEAVVKDVRFIAVFERIAKEAPETLQRPFNTFFGAFSSEEDFKRILAEHLVNHVDSLPNFYAAAMLWNRYRSDFVAAVRSPDLTNLCEAIGQMGQSLPEVDEGLTSLLKRIRSELSLAFDVPFVAELSNLA